jgi:predicted ferric reductase
MKNKGNNVIYISLVVTALLWLLSKSGLDSVIKYPLVSLNQIVALLATMLFAWSAILTTRSSFIENLFGGLDKVYHTHRKVSEWAFGLILLHPLFLMLDSSSNFLKWVLPVHSASGVNSGVMSLWIFTYLIMLTLLIRQLGLKYNIWKITHKFLTIPLFMAFIHVSKVTSDTSSFMPLGGWIKIWLLFALMSSIYMLVFYKYFAKKYEYKIKSIKKVNDYYDIRCVPTDKKISYANGQYVYVIFDSAGVTGESHPFCIASSSSKKELRLVIKVLGDYTATLDGLKRGEKAILYGPYGRISERFYNFSEDAVFIAGGVGIAPFLAMFNKNDAKDRNVGLYYSVRYATEDMFNEELADIADSSKNMHYEFRKTREGDGHFDISKIVKSQRDLKNTHFYLCASAQAMKSIKAELINNGVDSSSITLEDFDMI